MITEPNNIDTKVRKYRCYSYNDRLNAIMMSDRGMSSTEIAAVTGFNDSLIRYWVRRYRKNGLDGLKRKRYTPRSTAISESQGIKGFVRYIDNPEILNTQVEKLKSYGIIEDNIVIGDSAISLFNDQNVGLTVVLNSLFDLTSDLTGIIRLLSFALKKGITIVSLNDGRLEVNSKDKGILETLERYSYTDMRRIK